MTYTDIWLLAALVHGSVMVVALCVIAFLLLTNDRPRSTRSRALAPVEAVKRL